MKQTIYFISEAKIIKGVTYKRIFKEAQVNYFELVKHTKRRPYIKSKIFDNKKVRLFLEGGLPEAAQ